MTKFLVTVVDPGCDCCSYVPVDAYDSKAEIPTRYLNSNFDIEEVEDDE